MAGHSMSEKENLLFSATEDFEDESTPEIPSNRRSRLALKTWFLLCISIVSVAANILQAGFILWREASSYDCGLKNVSDGGIDVPVAIATEFGSPTNLTETDAVWKALDTSRGFVALDTEQQPLHSEPFPWDSSKSVYLLNGFHSLHCLRVMYVSFRQHQRNETQRYDFGHVLHCLDSLRADVLCAADDTPLSVGPGAQKDEKKMSRTRRCRDFKQLEDWAEENSACFEGLEPGEPGYQTLEEWRHCPASSPYTSVVEKYFAEPRAA